MRDTPAHVLATILRWRGDTLAVAESCTGGMIGAAITAIPGASSFFRGGVIAYDNAVKQSLLGVSSRTLDRHGAVSRETVRAMARGVRRLCGARCAIAVSGIAGPDGGSPEKPVGMVWIGAAAGARIVCREWRFSGTRACVRTQATDAALGLLIDLLRSSDSDVPPPSRKA